jgi:hypothetical protein
MQSQRAIEKLGAVREDVLRKQMVMPDGYVRDTVMYSITNDEWPRVRELLIAVGLRAEELRPLRFRGRCFDYQGSLLSRGCAPGYWLAPRWGEIW